MVNIKNKIIYLRKLIRELEYLYYVENNSIIPDYIYDMLIRKLSKIENNRSNFDFFSQKNQNYNYKIKNNFNKIVHSTPMLSLKNVFTKKEILLFHKYVNNLLNHKNIKYCCELKFDGVAVSLTYRNGMLIKAATRGDGNVGEDVTDNIKTIKNIPLYLNNKNNKIPREFEIRGEVFMPIQSFLKLNENMKIKGEKTFSNPRNAAAGSLRQLNAKITEKRKLMFYCYGDNLLNNNDLPDSHYDRLQKYKIFNIPINKYIINCNNIKEIFNFYQHIYKIRPSFGFDIDGIVIKIDSLILQKKLSCSVNYPKWAVAYKFPTQEKITTLLEIKYQVGRTGLIIPIAIIKPISILGTLINNVNLYNIGEIKRLQLTIGSKIVVRKAGEIIPQIIGVIKRKIKDNNKITLPDQCPICKTNIILVKRSKILYRCPASLTCKAQIKRKLEHFVSKKAINIIGIGSKLINKLVDYNLISNPADFFILNENVISNISNINIKNTKKILEAIKKARKTTLSRLIYSLGIPGIGETIANNLAKKYCNFENIINININLYMNINSIEKKAIFKIHDFFSDKNNILVINNLLKYLIIDN